jgi:hypothetical protein
MKDRNSKLTTIAITALVTMTIGFTTSVIAGGSQVTDAVIDKVESIINTKANSYFGANTEISVRKLKGDEPEWDIVTTRALSTMKDTNSIWFWQGGVGSVDQSGDRRTMINLGIGKRWLMDDDAAIAGVNVFADFEGSSKHSRMSIGGEYKRSNVEIHGNKYWATSGTKTVNGTEEKALDGYDFIFSGQAPFIPWINIVAKQYGWDRDNQDDVKGSTIGVEMQLTQSVRLEVGSQDNNYMNSTTYGKLTYALGGTSDQTNLMDDAIISSSAWESEESMKSHMLDKVERSNKIVVEFGGVTISRTD